jgi:hypothetical protein
MAEYLDEAHVLEIASLEVSFTAYGMAYLAVDRARSRRMTRRHMVRAYRGAIDNSRDAVAHRVVRVAHVTSARALSRSSHVVSARQQIASEYPACDPGSVRDLP